MRQPDKKLCIAQKSLVLQNKTFKKSLLNHFELKLSKKKENGNGLQYAKKKTSAAGIWQEYTKHGRLPVYHR